ncbi:Hydroquinone glucosyltransferase [Dendrobium catenatum]|uniref:Glycosyltransferase n=1 Tax=Dendrobium catenatum TaxID=906689 RepID=A0A2I0WW86_9ASPA|nr:Hydroquinone glucosyltransferase [Dendrobium catenatum]
MADANSSPHVVVVSSPGLGHITPFVELTKLLVLRHHFTATIITFSDLPFSLPSSISTIQLPVLELPADTDIGVRISLTMANSVSPLRQILISLQQTTRIAAVIFDLFGVDHLSMVKELHIPTYLFLTSNLFFLSFKLHLPALDESTVGEFRDLPEPLKLPGCVPLKGVDFLSPLQKRESETCAIVVHGARKYNNVDGILVNSFEALEAGAAKFLKQRGGGKPPVWPIGPLTASDSDMWYEDHSHDCIEWLNRHPSGSVIFICFGSGGALSWEQTRELALGLEMSEQRFLWVVRAACDTGLSGSFFNPNQSRDDPMEFLPEGFVENTKERGMTVMSWAPQRQVLGHNATGGFVSHCGWNSVLESLVNGVPIVAWPLYAEQKMNAVLLEEGAKVALRVKEGENGVVRREEVAKVVKELMEGEEGKQVRRGMQVMKKEAARAVGKEGSSYKALEELFLWFCSLLVAVGFPFSARF